MSLIASLTSLILQSAVLVVAPLLVGVVVQLFRRIGLQISASQHARMQAIAENAVIAAEEWAASRLKAKIPVSADKKLERALEAILYKLPGIDEEEARELVHSALPKVGLGSVGSDFFAKVREAQRS